MCVCVQIAAADQFSQKRISGTEMCQQETGDFQSLPDLLTNHHPQWAEDLHRMEEEESLECPSSMEGGVHATQCRVER